MGCVVGLASGRVRSSSCIWVAEEAASASASASASSAWAPQPEPGTGTPKGWPWSGKAREGVEYGVGWEMSVWKTDWKTRRFFAFHPEGEATEATAAADMAFNRPCFHDHDAR